jgi:2'-5' RNA ligase
LNSAGVGIVDSAMIDRFVLMRSALKPTGSEYSVVEEFPFSP